MVNETVKKQKKLQKAAIKAELEKRRHKRLLSDMSTLMGKFHNKEVGLAEKQQDIVEKLVSLQEEVKNGQEVVAKDTVEELKNISKEVAESSKAGQEVRQIQAGKLNKVETNTRKQNNILSQQNKILREDRAFTKQISESSKETVSMLKERLKGFTVSIFRNIGSGIESIRETVESVFDPENKSINVTVTNPSTGSRGKAGTIPFVNDNEVTKKARLDTEDRLYVNAAGVTLHAVVNTSASDGSSVYQATNPWIVGGTVSIAGGSVNVEGNFSADVTGSSVIASVENDGFGASVSNWEGASGLDVTSNIKTNGITQVYYELAGAAGSTTVYSNSSGFIISDFWMSSDVEQKARLILDGVTMPAFSFAANGGMVSNNTTPLTGSSQLEIATGASGTFSITLFGFNK